ncbi:MAG: DUF4835 family protein [Lewinellaceae bacterium]|nr:DUF4835 family protein [Lewinellaceae bacterium]
MTRYTAALLMVLTAWWLGTSSLSAQELNASVTINTPKLQSTDPKIFRTLEQDLRNLINETKWTDDQYNQDERIQCTWILAITKEGNEGHFQATLNINAVRPVYGSTYETQTFAYQDPNILFEYSEGTPIQYIKNVYNSNLVSIVTFYCNIILGLDYDTFSPFGGDPYFDAAQSVINQLPSNQVSEDNGWKSVGTRNNRYWIIENLRNARVKPLRNAYYEYHRQGLDMMYTDPVKGRAAMAAAIEQFDQVRTSYPSSMIIQLIATIKANEIVQIFKVADATQKTKVYDVMTHLDPSNARYYATLKT